MSNDPEIPLCTTHVRMINGTVGTLDKTAEPDYRVVQNAFFKAIVPGLERSLG